MWRAGDLASAICVERFNAAPDAAAKLVEFKAIPDSYKKRQFVEAGGWATMPGQTTPDRRAKAAPSLSPPGFLRCDVSRRIFSRRLFPISPRKERNR